MTKSKPVKIPNLTKSNIPPTKKFILRRLEDVSGTSGTGIVSVGILFPSGQCIMEWVTSIKNVEIFHSIADLERVHGHEGKTKIEFIEEE